MGAMSMAMHVDVTFRGMPVSPPIEAAIHRWVVRLEQMKFAIHRAEIVVEPAGRGRTRVVATAWEDAGGVQTGSATHADIYVAIGDAFRALHHQHSQSIPIVRLSFV